MDVCLVVEGTYPLEIGGVATWCDALIRGMPHVEFGVLRIGGPLPEDRSSWALEPPDNLVWAGALAPPLCETFEHLETWAMGIEAPAARLYQGVAPGYAGLAALGLARQHGVSFLLSEHASYVEELSRGHRWLESGVRAPGHDPIALFTRIMRHLRTSADGATALDDEVSAAQRADGCARSWAIANGVPDRGVVVAPERSRPSVLFLGRLHPLKGPDVLLDALDLRPGLDVDVLIAGPMQGDACWRHGLQRRFDADSRVQVLGACAQDAINTLRPDLVVVPSRSEAQPLVILEAMMAAVPVLATHVGQCRAMLEPPGEDAAGIVVEPDDPELMARALDILCARPELRSRLGARGRARGVAAYRQDTMVARYREVYEVLWEATREDV